MNHLVFSKKSIKILYYFMVIIIQSRKSFFDTPLKTGPHLRQSQIINFIFIKPRKLTEQSNKLKALKQLLKIIRKKKFKGFITC